MTTAVAEARTTGWTPDDEDSFAARLMAIRRRMKWGNTSEAARACGLTPENWRLWEQGRMPSRFVTICMQIAGRTGCDVDWLVYGPNGKRTTVVILDPHTGAAVNGHYEPLSARVLDRPRLNSARPVGQTRPVRRTAGESMRPTNRTRPIATRRPRAKA